jgi:CheY-like chemotaxis protein/nitrogen-specific signal transduction histidine kinase
VHTGISARVVRDRAGHVCGYQGIVQDVTERRRAEVALREALRRSEESDRLKSAFLANVSHEIRTPLNVILGYNELVRERLAKDSEHEPLKDLLDAIRRASHRLINTVHGVLDLARLESGSFDRRPAPLGLSKLIEREAEQVAPLARSKGLRLSARIEVPQAVVRFDEYCITKALQNLLDNAIKFAAHGEVTIGLFRDESGALVLEVRDTGIGIAESYLPRLFEPFTQEESGDARPFEGAGVGLAVAKGLLELNGARISVTTEKGKGASFKIHFDPTCEVRTTPRPGELAAPRENSRPTILVVEDDSDSQLYVQTILGRSYRIVKASSGKELRAALDRYAGDVSLVLMDVALRGDEDGISLTHFIRNSPEWSHVPVVATTAHALQECRLRAFEAGCSAFLTKPFTPRQLLALVEEFVNGSASPSPR